MTAAKININVINALLNNFYSRLKITTYVNLQTEVARFYLDNFYCFLQNKSSDRSGGANDINFGNN